jgi:hypothetical protein
LIGEGGVMLFPSHSRTAPKHHQPILSPFDFAFTAVLNALELPVTQVYICLFGVAICLRWRRGLNPHADCNVDTFHSMRMLLDSCRCH